MLKLFHSYFYDNKNVNQICATEWLRPNHVAICKFDVPK